MTTLTAVTFILGLVAIVAGAALIYAPAGFIFGGLGLVLLAILSNDASKANQ